eukprot:ANDGO_03223.mRNA.1 Myotubularin-related protein 1
MDEAAPEFPLRSIPGEQLTTFFPHVYLLSLSRIAVEGIVFVTNYRLVWSAPKDLRQKFQDVEVPLMTIFRVEKVGGKNSKTVQQYLIEIHCKDFRILRFGFEPERAERRQTAEFLRSLCFTGSIENTFAFANQEAHDLDWNGWDVFNIEQEFVRQGVLRAPMSAAASSGSDVPSIAQSSGSNRHSSAHSHENTSNLDANHPFSQWRLCRVNERYGFSDTYPSLFVVPCSVSDEQLQDVGSFRSKARIPVLSWVSPRTGAAITRSSQPMTGILRASSTADQQLLDAIRKASLPFSQTADSSTGDGGPKLLIVDLRPRANAVANQAKGAGFETASQYPWCELRFMNIENIHVMRDSFRRLMELCLSSGGVDPKWCSLLESTGWAEHVRGIMSTARCIAEAVEGLQAESDVPIPVLAHCSDGWDRTSQTVALAMLMLDPHYRTMQGFAQVVEKEWASTGHKFTTRLGHGNKNWFHDQGCPVFLQFLDSVYQLLTQFPTAFEFTDSFLTAIADHLYSCRFGTFLCDSERERKAHSVPEHTVSLWTVLLAKKHRGKFLNPFYIGIGIGSESAAASSPLSADFILLPDCSPVRWVFWDRYYLRFCRRLLHGETYQGGGFDAYERILQRGISWMEHATLADESGLAMIQTFQREIGDLHKTIRELRNANEELSARLAANTVSSATSSAAPPSTFLTEDAVGDE